MVRTSRSVPKSLRIRRVLAATDLSTPADEAIRLGHAWAEKSGARLDVVHVVPNLIRSAPLFPQWNRPAMLLTSEVEREAVRALRAQVRRLTHRADPSFEAIVTEGIPHVRLIEVAERRRADLIVVGSHGYTGLERVLIGGEAERVVRYAPCAVLVARKVRRTGKVLAATDFSVPSIHALRAAAAEARRRKAALTILHALHVPAPYPDVGTMSGALTSDVYAEVRARMRHAAEDELEGLRQRLALQATPLIVEGPPAQAIIRAAEALPAELVVVGTVGRTGLTRAVLGSVAESVVRMVHCPVLIVR